MQNGIDLGELPAPIQKAMGASAPPALRQMAAKGVLPGAKPEHVVTVLAALSGDSDPVLAQVARESLQNLPATLKSAAVRVDLQTGVIHALVQAFHADVSLVPELLRLPRISEESLSFLAEQASEAIGEILATNESLLLRYPLIIERLYMNKRVRMSTADRILELAVRNHLELSIPAYKEAAQAILNELIPEACAEPTPDDVLFFELEDAAATISMDDEEDTHEVDEEGKEALREKFKPIYARIADMTITQKIRRAILGTGAERLLLVRDHNRLVAAAAASSPMLNENEAVRIAANRNVSEEVLRIIAMNKNFTRNYMVKLNLVTNPKTALSFSARIVGHLRDNDLRSISKSKNVPANIQLLARQQLTRKQGGKG
jgi:hypothetical protein